MAFTPHWKDDITNEEYHANREFYSSTNIKTAAMESLEAFHLSVTSQKKKVNTDAQLLGTIIHSAILEGENFLGRYVVRPDFSSYGHANSNAHKAAKAQWISENQDKVIITQEDLDLVQGIRDSVFKHKDALAILKNSQFERSGYYEDSETGIPLRIRYDAYDAKWGILTDLKSVASAKKRDFSNAIMKYRYDLSLAMYGVGIEAIDGKGPEDYVFIAVEKTPPYHVAVYPLSKRAIQIGLDDYRYALDRIAECRKTGIWTPFQEHVEEIDLPPYFEGMRHVR